jgi:hypothetical protein
MSLPPSVVSVLKYVLAVSSHGMRFHRSRPLKFIHAGRVGPSVIDTRDGCNSECMIAPDEAYCCAVAPFRLRPLPFSIAIAGSFTTMAKWWSHGGEAHEEDGLQGGQGQEGRGWQSGPSWQWQGGWTGSGGGSGCWWTGVDSMNAAFALLREGQGQGQASNSGGLVPAKGQGGDGKGTGKGLASIIEAEEPLPGQTERLFHASSDPDLLRLGEPVATPAMSPSAMSPFHFQGASKGAIQGATKGATKGSTTAAAHELAVGSQGEAAEDTDGTPAGVPQHVGEPTAATPPPGPGPVLQQVGEPTAARPGAGAALPQTAADTGDRTVDQWSPALAAMLANLSTGEEAGASRRRRGGQWL